MEYRGEDLRNRLDLAFSASSERCRDDLASSCWTAILSGYTEAHRAYHNLDHLRAMFRQLDAAIAWLTAGSHGPESMHGDSGGRGVDLPPAVVLATLFHDVVYDPRRSDNEERSAELAEVLLREGGLVGDKVSLLGGGIVNPAPCSAPALRSRERCTSSSSRQKNMNFPLHRPSDLRMSHRRRTPEEIARGGAEEAI